MATHRLSVRVYYEDTDLAGVVYYANYLKFLERGRTEALRAAGWAQSALKAELGLVLLVTRVEIDYRAPALFDDLLTVETRVERLGAARIDMAQRVTRGDAALCEAMVRVACVGADGRAARMPPGLRAALAERAEAPER